MKGVKEGAVDEISRPDHGCGPHKESPGKTSKTVAGAQCRDAKQDLESPPKMLPIKLFLCYYHIGSIKRTTTVCGLQKSVGFALRNRNRGNIPITYIRHDHNHNMFLVIEMSWPKVELEAKKIDHLVRENQIPSKSKRVGDQLYGQCRKQDRGVP